jgi:hypothetical protein
MVDRRYTAAQLKAFAWLPSDGSWRDSPGRFVSALSSLSLSSGLKLAESEWGDFGPRGGRILRWRLTPHGRAEQARLMP